MFLSTVFFNFFSRSREGAWIEIPFIVLTSVSVIGRSREGAWIEIRRKKNKKVEKNVAPARERGLKWSGKRKYLTLESRSREGAWIEIVCQKC